MSRRSRGVAKLERVEALLDNPELYALADVVPEPDPGRGGRRRAYPAFMWLLYEALISVYGSARQVEAELAHPDVWRLIRQRVRARFPHRTDRHLPAQPMRRYHYLYARTRYLTHPAILQQLVDLHRTIAAEQARELGLLDPDGPGSWTHPDPSRLLYADGKVITPLYRAKPGDTRVDRTTGEIAVLRYEPDAGLHFEGDGNAAWGTKFVLAAVRSDHRHGRVILDVDWVPTPGGEARTALNLFTRLAPLVPGAQGVVYDTALRGTHHQHLLRELGLLPINRVTAAVAATKPDRRAGGRRVEKSARVEDKTITLPDGTRRTLHVYTHAGALGLAERSDTGELAFTELLRVRTHRTQDKRGRYRWYNDYQLPDRYGAGIMTVRLHATPDDEARGFNRTENLRPIPPSDPDFARLFRRRNDAESINRALEDTLWLGRAHSVGHHRQHLNLLGFALVTNSLALRRHRQRRAPDQLAA